MKKIEEFEEFYILFQGLEQSKRIEIWNEFQDDTRGEQQIWSMDDLDTILDGHTPEETIRLAFYGYDANAYREENNQERGQFNPNRPYFYFNGYGNLVSLEEVEIFEDKLSNEKATFDKANASDLFNNYEWYEEDGELRNE